MIKMNENPQSGQQEGEQWSPERAQAEWDKAEALREAQGRKQTIYQETPASDKATE